MSETECMCPYCPYCDGSGYIVISVNADETEECDFCERTGMDPYYTGCDC